MLANMAGAAGIFIPGASEKELRVLGKLTEKYSMRENDVAKLRKEELRARNIRFGQTLRADSLVLLGWEHRATEIFSPEDFMKFFIASYPFIYIAVSIYRFGKNKVIE